MKKVYLTTSQPTKKLEKQESKLLDMKKDFFFSTKWRRKRDYYFFFVQKAFANVGNLAFLQSPALKLIDLAVS